MSTDTPEKTYAPAEWEDVPCPVCGNRKSRLHERFGKKLQYTYVKCLTCKNIYQCPRPKYDETFLKKAYDNYYLFDANHEYKESAYNDFSREVGEILDFDVSRSSILDVGCAMGDFLYQAIKHYPRAFGVEIAENMAKHTSEKLQIPVFTDRFETFETDERFSCIHMSHIIEHVPNPNDWMVRVKTLLAPEGILMLCVPNILSFTCRVKLLFKKIGLRRGRWKDGGRTPDHLFEPTVEGMRFFMKSNGFELLKIYSYSRSNMVSKGFGAYIFHRVLKLGSNIRLYARPAGA